VNKREIGTNDVKIDQKPPIIGDANVHPTEVVQADPSIISKDYMDELAFNEEPLTIMLVASSEPNAPASVPVWVNGKGAEILNPRTNKWMEITYLPVGIELTVKRKYVGNLIQAKLDKVTTDFGKPGEENPVNRINRFTSSYHSFQIINDPNPKGRAWFMEMQRRNK